MDDFDKNLCKEIENVIGALLTAENKKYDETVERIKDKLLNSKYDFTNPDIFNTLISFQVEQLLRQLANKVYNANNRKIDFIFVHYSFIETHIQKLIEKKTHTSSCITDKSRWLIKEYLKYISFNEKEEFPDQEHYWIPKFGTITDWIEYINTLEELYYGNIENYLKAYKKLLDAEIRKYEHTKYTKFVYMKDGEKVIGAVSYDNEHNPYLEENEEYVYIHKRSFSSKRNYEDATEKGELIGRLLYKVPKTEIAKIEIKEEKEVI